MDAQENRVEDDYRSPPCSPFCKVPTFLGIVCFIVFWIVSITFPKSLQWNSADCTVLEAGVERGNPTCSTARDEPLPGQTKHGGCWGSFYFPYAVVMTPAYRNNNTKYRAYSCTAKTRAVAKYTHHHHDCEATLSQSDANEVAAQWKLGSLIPCWVDENGKEVRMRLSEEPILLEVIQGWCAIGKKVILIVFVPFLSVAFCIHYGFAWTNNRLSAETPAMHLEWDLPGCWLFRCQTLPNPVAARRWRGSDLIHHVPLPQHDPDDDKEKQVAEEEKRLIA
eukprot:gnl/MRDRNA2_/MRDRNA2_125221_c0_seq1.p1 gnl/MRDRNA2_/MRDRNA2_125221_c0~~gnl/MRDRNA2_/MRDRNA2_125221_c0_seq1.p1  ORF type:complete len:279 (+),score=25.47 gnl/MRDRNA2_/MRDRNA2_125221_c0_seq1:186-1022(+)